MESLVEVIAAKRDGHELSAAQIEHIISSFSAQELADYQMTAFLMAVFLRGMTDAETVALTKAMLESGVTIDLSSIPGPKVDKHSTGGVGDKVSIALVPIVAACCVNVPMVSGRGLGHTGGTLDKLEAIPGFNVNLDPQTFASIIRSTHGCMIGQTDEIAPADRRIYALRDVTATVESIPLIVASILSKKIAAGIDSLVLDVKVGKGAFMKNIRDARQLAETLVRVGSKAGKRVSVVLTRMDAPLGRTIGNALEASEAFDVLFGRAPADLTECTFALCAEMLLLADAANDRADAYERISEVIRTGKAVEVMERIIAAQGGNPGVVRNPLIMPQAPHVIPLAAHRSGFVCGIDALELGLSSLALGAGRTRADQSVDHAVGIVINTHVGERVVEGMPVVHVHARDTVGIDDVLDRILAAFEIGDVAPEPRPIVLDRC